MSIATFKLFPVAPRGKRVLVSLAVIGLGFAGAGCASSDEGDAASGEGGASVFDCIQGSWQLGAKHITEGPVGGAGEEIWRFEGDLLRTSTNTAISYVVPEGEEGSGFHLVETEGVSEQAYEVSGDKLVIGAAKSASGTQTVIPVDSEGSPTGEEPKTGDYAALDEGSSFTAECTETTLALTPDHVDAVPADMQPRLEFTRAE